MFHGSFLQSSVTSIEFQHSMCAQVKVMCRGQTLRMYNVCTLHVRRMYRGQTLQMSGMYRGRTLHIGKMYRAHTLQVKETTLEGHVKEMYRGQIAI